MILTRKTIGQFIDTIAHKHPDRDAIVHTEMDVQYDYGLLSLEIDLVAKGLIKAGIRKGDKIALWATNVPEWIISMLALAKMGAIIVPIDPGAGKEDLRFILEQSECRGIIMVKGMGGDEYLNMVRDVMANVPNLEITFVIDDKAFPGMTPWTKLREMGKEVDSGVFREIEEAVKAEDPVAIMYTSGTTGKPKGVVLDHLGLINKSMFSTERQGVNHTDRLCLFFPLFHMFGNTCIALAGLLRGAALIMPCQTFDPSKILNAINYEKCTAVYASPSMVISLLEHPEFDRSKWESVHKGTIGGAPCPMDLMRRLVKEIGMSKITVGYGITETSSWITMTKPSDPIELRVSTIGMPLDCNEVKIVDPATGEDLPPQTQGELCTKGFLMKEYYKMPGATASAIDREGWFHSGDLGEMAQNGYVKITGRLKDVILREGVEIYPVELEEVIYKLPDVSEVQVFGFSHPEKGQEVAAWVRLKEGSQLSIDDISEYVNDNVDVALRPQYFKIVSGFPMTRSGKVQKFKLTEIAQREYLG
ncbi:MAG TPA: AMP-binding protein [Desulfobacteraceae bacterium]|nr:AMP-binding protein [Desulfobacteraceae bacterium]